MAKSPYSGVTSADLIAQNQALGIEQDSIRAQRIAIADELRRRSETAAELRRRAALSDEELGDAIAEGVTLSADAKIKN